MWVMFHSVEEPEGTICLLINTLWALGLWGLDSQWKLACCSAIIFSTQPDSLCHYARFLVSLCHCLKPSSFNGNFSGVLYHV